MRAARRPPASSVRPAGTAATATTGTAAQEPRLSWRRLASSLVIWLVPIAALSWPAGSSATWPGSSRRGPLTFGGAYAVLPFVASRRSTTTAGSRRRTWSPALRSASRRRPADHGQHFVGFLAGYHVEGGLAWGVAGATVATLARSSRASSLSSPARLSSIGSVPSGTFANSLNGITIAVVGAIAALAVFVARHALIVNDRLDWVLTALAVAAFLACGD